MIRPLVCYMFDSFNYAVIIVIIRLYSNNKPTSTYIHLTLFIYFPGIIGLILLFIY